MSATEDPTPTAAVTGEAHDHSHRDVSGGWLRPAVFGAMDGLVTNISLIAGVAGAGVARHTVVLTGMAGLVAGAFSMALGEYTSVQTQNEAVEAEARVERREIERHPEAEQAELAAVWESHGMSPTTAQLAAQELMANTDKAVWVHIREELGVDMNVQPSPWTAAAMSFLFFAVGALIPLLPPLLGVASLWVALLVGAVGLFVIGAVVSRYTVRSPLVNGARQLVLGLAAAGVTYGVGHLIGARVG